jgi:DNA processing protein
VSDLAVSTFAAETGTHVLERPRSERFASFLRTFDERAVRAWLHERGIRYLGRSEQSFPSLLRAIHDPPPGLYLRGEGPVDALARPSVAIVGARSCSAYGRSVARLLAREAAAAGLVVVSGLARGIDGEAHRGALEAGGTTVAVLGCGIDRDYPAAHGELAARIRDTGLVVSEYAPGVEPAPWRFPARNRIIAGLCSATVAVEARERSGALITADFALEEGREVLAVPGEITSALSAGTNALLRLGATPLLGAEDLLSAFGIEPVPQPSAPLDGPAAAVVTALAEAVAGPDELARRTGLSSGQLAAVLTELELAGLVVADAGVFRATMARP